MFRDADRKVLKDVARDVSEGGLRIGALDARLARIETDVHGILDAVSALGGHGTATVLGLQEVVALLREIVGTPAGEELAEIIAACEEIIARSRVLTTDATQKTQELIDAMRAAPTPAAGSREGEES